MSFYKFSAREYAAFFFIALCAGAMAFLVWAAYWDESRDSESQIPAEVQKSLDVCRKTCYQMRTSQFVFSIPPVSSFDSTCSCIGFTHD